MYRRLILFLATLGLISLINLPLSAQEPSSVEKSVVSNKETVTKSPETSPGATEVKLVTGIDVKGNKSISTNTIISKMKSKIGAPYQENVVSDDLKRLYLLGYFSDIKIDTQDYKNGIKILIAVSERPLIEKIAFEGIMRITTKEEKIKESLKSKEGQYLDYPNLSEDIKILKQMYEKIGYNQASIEYKVDIDKETNKAKVLFNITEGRRVAIKDIIIEGNHAFSRDHILRLIKTKIGWLFNAGVIKEEVLKEDMERIKSFYRKNGYTDVSVDYDTKADAKKPYLIYITIHIKEGKKYLVGNLTLSGNKDISEKDLLAKLKDATPGKVFSQESMKQDISSMLSLYFDRGYIAAQIQETTALNSQSGRIDITYNITESEIMYVDKIKVRGNVKTKDIVVRRELRIRPGDRFDGEKLRRSKERLQNLGFFDEVSYDTQETSSADKKDLVVDVKEAKTGSFSFGGGYSTVDQFVGFAEVEQKNFDWTNFPYFTGAGQDLKFRASFGSVSNGYDLSFTEPWTFDYPITSGFDAYQSKHSKDTDVGYGYDEKTTGGDVRLGKELSEYMRADLSYRYDKVKISNIDDNATDDLRSEVGTNVTDSITPVFTFDSRDNVFDTTKGNLVTSSFEWAGGFLGGDKNFWKFFGRASHYFPMPRNSVLEFRGRIGLADPYKNTPRVPIFERFFTGGSSTIRGYDERKVGPVDPVTKDPLGGASMLIGNIEYTYPLFSFLKLAAFYDVGNTWEKLADIGSSKNAFGVANSGGFKSGLGLGIRVKTPIGPLMLDYGIPLNKAPGEDNKKSGKFHFSFSRGF
ncbi:MAG: outer membrane protein assembly factor BamA [Candidatus Omnitrophica bacterium]|nr:outer membrane protein assembly factor BamA [Candidatus Omnitrophota bacterium]